LEERSSMEETGLLIPGLTPEVPSKKAKPIAVKRKKAHTDIRQVAELTDNHLAPAQHQIAPFSSNGDVVYRYRRIRKTLQHIANNIGVIRPGQAAVARHQHNQDAFHFLAFGQQWVQVAMPGLGSNVVEHLPGFGSIRAGIVNRLDRFSYLAGTDSLQGARDLGDILYTSDAESYFSQCCHK